MIELSEETERILNEVRKDFEEHERKIDKELEAQLKKQRERAYKLISETEEKLRSKHTHLFRPLEKLKLCRKMREYVAKWGWMPDSYKRMCRCWKSGQELDVVEWGGVPNLPDKHTSIGSASRTLRREYGRTD